MVGDRLYTDIEMARRAGVLGILVLTGEATAEDARQQIPPPDLTVADLAELGEKLRAARADSKAMSRGTSREAVRTLSSQSPLDVLIVGGGVSGAGVARDAALRGLKVGLVEQHDFAFGTSSRSSRLLHGGLRYLAQGRVGLVQEASVEKTIIHRIAPHLAEPLPFIFPTYRGNRNWVLWQLKIGVKIYDLLCRGRNLGRSTWLSRGEVRRRVPVLTARRSQRSGSLL